MEITTEENRISIDGVSYPKDGFYVKPISKGVALVAMSKSWSIKILVDGTTIDGSPVADRDELMTFFNEQGFKSGGSGPGTEVSWGSVTGDIEDQADLVDYIAEQDAFSVVDVTQEAYIDKAINVKAFNNTGMSYSEGSIDFGITRDKSHTMGLYAFKQGGETTASGVSSSAFGNQATASGDTSSAFGYQTTASGEASSAFGAATTASGTASSAFGVGATASGDSSVAFGNETTASGEASTASGAATTASGIYSTAFGAATTASGTASAAFGHQATANEYASLAIGRYSTDGAVETSWTPGSAIFKVGNGTSTSNRSNAYVLYNDGRSEQIKDVEVTEIGQGVVIKSPDGTRWRITVDNNGDLTTTSL